MVEHDDTAASAPPTQPVAPNPRASKAWVSEELLNVLVDTVRDYAIFLLDPDGKVASWNAGAQRIKGYTAEEILGKPLSLFYPPTEIAQGTPFRNLKLAASDGQFHDTGWRVRKDGSLFWAEVTIVALRDEERRLIGFGKVTRDLTERKLDEEELRRSEEHFRLIVESVVDYAIFMLDPTGHIISWNPGAARIKGYTEAQILGKHFSIFYPIEEKQRGKPTYELAMAAAEGRFEDEGWRLRRDGTRFWANVIITALRDAHGQLVGFAKVTRDLTERKNQEEDRVARARAEAARVAAEEHAARQEQILAVIAHDVRQPLTSIGGLAQLTSRAIQAQRFDQAQKSADTITGVTRQIDALLTNLIDSVRWQSGQIRVEMGEVSLDAYFRDLFQRISGAIPSERVHLEAPATRVRADSGHLERIFVNLIANAVKYSQPETPIHVRVEENEDEVVISVADRGIGIASADLPRIFERGFRTTEARSVGDGSGLGLYIVQELVHAHGGRIWVESQPGQGSTFFIALPRYRE